jgi:hypothetical protein
LLVLGGAVLSITTREATAAVVFVKADGGENGENGENGEDANEMHLFGVGVSGPTRKAKKRVQLVEVAKEPADDWEVPKLPWDYRVVPVWWNALSNEVYPAAVGREKHNKGVRYLKDNRRWPAGDNMRNVPILVGLFDEGTEYRNFIYH